MKEYRLDGMTVKEILVGFAAEGNRKFVESLNPGVENILGIRLPRLREIARKVASDDWQTYLDTADTYYMEERMLYGMVLRYIRPLPDVETYLAMVTRFVGRINGWAVCDAFAFGGGRRFVEENRERLWQYVSGWMLADSTYGIRFGVVMSLKYFADAEHAPQFFNIIERITDEAYYVRMGIAWAVAEYFIKCQDLTRQYLCRSRLDKFTFNKSLQKITESLRVDRQTKEEIKGMRR